MDKYPCGTGKNTMEISFSAEQHLAEIFTAISSLIVCENGKELSHQEALGKRAMSRHGKGYLYAEAGLN